jgi:hypothetical protein
VAGGAGWPKIDPKDETTMVFSPTGAQVAQHLLKPRIDWILAGVGAGRSGRQ